MPTTVETRRLLQDRPPRTLREYRAAGGGSALEKALALPREETIRAVSKSGLRGRGGAGFPAGRKWQTCLDEVSQHPGTVSYFCCNAAEGEPATFKDRYLIRHNPYQLVEAVAIAAYCCAADTAYIGLKSSFTNETAALRRAMDEMAEAGLLGDLTIRLVGGPEEYLFGEETGLLEVIEGREPMPRVTPPYMEGLFSTPGNPTVTVANNVETLFNVVPIVLWGPGWFREVGTERSPGTMVFTLVGDVRRPGVYELPLGTPLSTLLFDIGGGPRDDRRIKAVVPGASHAVITEDVFDTPMDFDSLKQVGSSLGSAGFTVYDDTACMVRVAELFSRFLYVESCGQCNPCKLHSGEITDGLRRLDAGQARPEDVQHLLRLTEMVTDGQRCYLATAEQVLVRSILRYFIDEMAEHLDNGCPRPRELAIPKIVDFDETTGNFRFDAHQMIKKPDWTYEPEG